MASAMGNWPATARLAAVAAAGQLPTATNGRQNSYTTPGDTTESGPNSDTASSEGQRSLLGNLTAGNLL